MKQGREMKTDKNTGPSLLVNKKKTLHIINITEKREIAEVKKAKTESRGEREIAMHWHF